MFVRERRNERRNVLLIRPLTLTIHNDSVHCIKICCNVGYTQHTTTHVGNLRVTQLVIGTMVYIPTKIKYSLREREIE